MKDVERLIYVTLAAVLFIGLFLVCSRFAADVTGEYSGEINVASGKKADGTRITPADVDLLEEINARKSVSAAKTCTVTIAGNIEASDALIKSAYDQEKDTFDFSEYFKYVKSYFSDRHLVVSNLEGSFFDVEKQKETKEDESKEEEDENPADAYGISDTGAIRLPEGLASQLYDTGFNMLQVANHQSLMAGGVALTKTVKTLNAANIKTAGIYNDIGNSYQILTLNGIKAAVLAYSNTAGQSETEDVTATGICLLNNYDQNQMTRFANQVKTAKGEGAQVILAMVDFETEAGTQETDKEALAEKLLDAGANVVVGTGNNTSYGFEVKSNGIIFYSIGNLMSSETIDSISGSYIDTSSLLNLTVSRDSAGITKITEVGIMPMMIYASEDKYMAIPVVEAYEDKLKYDSVLSDEAKSRVEALYNSYMSSINTTGADYTSKDHQLIVDLEGLTSNDALKESAVE